MEKQPKSNNEVREKISDMVKNNFTPKHSHRTQEEIQGSWDAAKAEQSKKFDPNNLEQGELFQ